MDDQPRISRRHALVAAGGFGALVAAGVAGAENTIDVNVGFRTERGRAAARRAATEVVREFGFDALTVRTSPEAAEGLARNPNVRYVETDGRMHAIDHAVEPVAGDPSEDQVLPWGIARVNADVAHHEGETGSGASVAIVDTGIDPDHETLAVAGGRNFTRGSPRNWRDRNGHGTHCAGTASALDNGVGVVGTSTAADLYAVKVLGDDGGGRMSDVAAGLEWTADRGIDVASLSLGGGYSNVVKDACKDAAERGTLLVAAAGNGGSNSDVSYPAAYETVIAVSATDEDDELANFSSRGDAIELAAPGVGVLSSYPDDEYGPASGTSMACPHVSGAGALLVAQGYSSEEARERLADTATELSLDETEQGRGLLDVAAAVGIEPKPALAVETGEATAVGKTSATLEGVVVDLGSADNARAWFEYGKRGEGLEETTEAQRVGETTFEIGVDDLDPGTEYAFRATAETDEPADDAVGRTCSFVTGYDDGGFLEVRILGTNEPINGGEFLEVTAELENTGDGETTQEVALVVGSGEDVVDTETVAVAAAGTTTVELGYDTYPVQQDVEFPVWVESRDDADERLVTVSAADGDEASTDPVVDDLTVEDASNPRWSRIRVDWVVSDDDGALEELELVLERDGAVVDSTTTSIDGAEDTGEDEFRGDYESGAYDVTLTVTDTAGNAASATESVRL